jgi:hypothetical protein
MFGFMMVPALCAAAVLSGGPESKRTQVDDDARAILAVERAAFERWAKGDLSGFLDASDSEVDYFDPFLDTRLEGLTALRALYESYEKAPAVQVVRWEMINPRVVVSGNMGVLTFNFVSYTKSGETRWNTTEVYRRKNGRWRIIHTHWALTKPQLANKPADQ